MTSTICPPCTHGNHSECMGDEEVGCDCADSSHDAAKKLQADEKLNKFRDRLSVLRDGMQEQLAELRYLTQVALAMQIGSGVSDAVDSARHVLEAACTELDTAVRRARP